VQRPLREFGTIRIQVEAYRAADLRGQVRDEPSGVGAAGSDDRAEHCDRAIAPGRRESGDAVTGFEDPQAFGERGELPQQIAAVGTESGFIDFEDGRHVRGRGGARIFPQGARCLAEAADEGSALANGPEAKFGIQRLAEVRGEQRHRGVTSLGDQVRHQRAAEPLAAEAARDQHHAGRREVGRVPGQYDSASQPAVWCLHAEGLRFSEQQRPFRFLRRPAAIDGQGHAVLEVFGTKPADGRERNASTVSQHAP
jgi:hypothetical protein